MKAITISQPYASLIADGEKWIENRTWPTNYRGPIAIHAGLGRQYLTKEEIKAYPTGCVIAIANLVACVTIQDIRSMFGKIPATNRRWEEAAQHAHAEGPFCWILEDISKIEPEKATGKQGLWNWNQLEVQRRLF